MTQQNEWTKNRYEGWTAEDFLQYLEPYFNPARFNTRDEVKEWTSSNQPYYKKPIKVLVDYFWQRVVAYKKDMYNF